MFKTMFKITVKENEKVLLYKDEKLVDVLGVGIHRGLFAFGNYNAEVYSLGDYGISNAKAKILYKMYPELIEKYFTVVSLEENERAYIYIDGKFHELLETATVKLYWSEYDIVVEKIDVKENYIVDKKHTNYIDKIVTQYNTAQYKVVKYLIDKNSTGSLYINEKFHSILEAGKYFYYTDFTDIKIQIVSKLIQEIEITGQELLSHDKVTLRCNLTMHYKVVDEQEYLNSTSSPTMYLYKQLQFATREHLGALNIDEILSKQHTLSKEILEKFYTTCLAIGVKVEGVHIKDIILPGDMREIFNQVIEASKKAEANNIQRREETASTRSLLNTAKLMSDNPALARLKELEALEKITQTIWTLNVYGGLDGVMNGLVDLKGRVG